MNELKKMLFFRDDMKTFKYSEKWKELHCEHPYT